MISLEVYRVTHDGIPIDMFSERDMAGLEYAYGDKSIGAMELSLPRKGRSPNEFTKDQIFEIYRIVDGVTITVLR